MLETTIDDADVLSDGELVVRKACSQRTHTTSDLLQQFASSDIDEWTIVSNLASSTHTGVRDYLVNLMYDIHPDKLDFFLPQLCCLLAYWPHSDSEGLQRFLLYKCTQSLHCAMKVYWTLLSMAPYCDEEDRKNLCLDFAKKCETTVVNACVPKYFLPSPSTTATAAAAATATAPISSHELERVDALIVRNLRVLERLRSLQPRLQALARRLGSSLTHIELPYTAHLKTSLAPDPIPRSHSTDSFMSLDGQCGASLLSERRASDSRSKSPSIISSRSSIPRLFSPRPISAASYRGFDMFLAKQQMAEFFNSELHLIAELEEISNDLLQYPRSHRNMRLQRLLTVLNERACRGLYFPNCTSNEPHYTILRILPQEGVALSSRDKVPFLMLVEVLVSGFDCSGEVHTHYQVDRDSCRRRLLELMKNSAQLPSPVASSHDSNLFTNNHSAPPSNSHSCDSESNISCTSSPTSMSKSSRDNHTSKLAYSFGELLEEKKVRVRKSSAFGRLADWDLKMMIFKSGDDCRQEHLAMQIITLIDNVFKEAKLPLALRPFQVLVTSPTSGMIEVVPDAKSIDSLKKSLPEFISLLWFFENHFGPRGSPEFAAAQQNFVESMAAYSLVCYLLQIKDRHNGNILLDNTGRVIHIDFGFMLSNSPGGNINFERAPFKLTEEYIEVMEGEESEVFSYYRLLIIRGFLELRQHCDKVVTLASILFNGPHQDCFYTQAQCIIDLRERFHATASEQQCIEFVYSLVSQSINNWRSVQYDSYQRISNGIL